jgi:hypothetical protein
MNRSDPIANSKLGFGCSVSHSRKGRPRGGHTWWCPSPVKARRRPGHPAYLGRQRRHAVGSGRTETDWEVGGLISSG